MGGQIDQLIIQNELLNAQTVSLGQKYTDCNETVKKYEQLMKQKDLACEEKVKDAKPGLWTMISTYLGVLGLGLLIGVLL